MTFAIALSLGSAATCSDSQAFFYNRKKIRDRRLPGSLKRSKTNAQTIVGSLRPFGMDSIFFRKFFTRAELGKRINTLAMKARPLLRAILQLVEVLVIVGPPPQDRTRCTHSALPPRSIGSKRFVIGQC